MSRKPNRPSRAEVRHAAAEQRQPPTPDPSTVAQIDARGTVGFSE